MTYPKPHSLLVAKLSPGAQLSHPGRFSVTGKMFSSVLDSLWSIPNHSDVGAALALER